MLSSNQLLELFVVLWTIDRCRYAFSKTKSAFVHAEAKAGSVRPDTLPNGIWGVPFNALQALGCFLIPTTYIVVVVGSGLQQPAWMNAFALPEVIFDVELEEARKIALRVFACVTCISTDSVTDNVFEHLGDQYHPIGRREKPRVIQSGPYAWIRHPLYVMALLQTVFQSVAYWSYAPLFSLIALALVFAVKIQIEEAAILRDDATREEYRAYMRKVPAKLIPYIW